MKKDRKKNGMLSVHKTPRVLCVFPLKTPLSPIYQDCKEKSTMTKRKTKQKHKRESNAVVSSICYPDTVNAIE